MLPASSGIHQQSGQVSLNVPPPTFPLPKKEVVHGQSSLSAKHHLLAVHPPTSGALVQLHGMNDECTSGKMLPHQASLCLTTRPSLLTHPLLRQPGFPGPLSYISFQLINNPLSINDFPLLMNSAFPALSKEETSRL